MLIIDGFCREIDRLRKGCKQIWGLDEQKKADDVAKLNQTEKR